MEEKNYEIVNLKIKKQVKPVKVVNYKINAANCNVVTMMQYKYCLRNIHNRSTAISRQIICVDIVPEYFCDKLTTLSYIITRNPYIVVCKNNALNLVLNWCGSMEDCLSFHSILAYLPYRNIHTMP